MMLQKEEVVFVMEHRLMESQLRRHFVGRVRACTEQAVRVEGYLFIYDSNHGTYFRKKRSQTRIIPLVDSRLSIMVLPEKTDLDNICYFEHPDGGLVVTDGREFELDVSEFSNLR